MIIASEKIRIELTLGENLPAIIQIEKDNAGYINTYDLQKHQAVINNEDEKHLSIFDKSDNSLIGHIILAGLKNENGSIELRRIVISRKGHGFGKDSIRLIKKYCFGDLQAHRIWLDVFVENTRAIRLYKSQGFITEGILRDSIRKNGRYHSLLIMSVLSTDSDPVKY